MKIGTQSNNSLKEKYKIERKIRWNLKHLSSTLCRPLCFDDALLKRLYIFKHSKRYSHAHFSG